MALLLQPSSPTEQPLPWLGADLSVAADEVSLEPALAESCPAPPESWVCRALEMGRGRLGLLLGLSSCGSVPPPSPAPPTWELGVP